MDVPLLDPAAGTSAKNDRLSALEERLGRLKDGQSQGGTPLLQSFQSPEVEVPSCSAPKPVGGLAGHTAEPLETCVDFDYCFKLVSPTLIADLHYEACKEGGVSVEQKSARETAHEQAVSDALRENEWFRMELAQRHEAAQKNMPRHRFPRRHPRRHKASTALGPIQSEHVEQLFGEFFRERRDRQALAYNGQAHSLQEAQRMVLSLLLEFFHREEERYQTYVFHSIDRDEIFLCVKMCEDTAASHAENASFMVELSQEEVAAQLNVRIPDDGPQTPAYAHYRQYLAEAGLLKAHPKEANPDQNVTFTKVDRIALIYDRMTNILDLDAMKKWGMLLDYYPVHTLSRLLELRAKLTQCNWLFSAPHDDIRNYFGSEIALHFVFSCCLCKHLCWLVLGSVLATIYVAMKTNSLLAAASGFVYGHKHPEVRAALALFTILWTQYFSYALKRQVSWKLVRWGEGLHLGSSAVKPRENPEFDGLICPSEVDSMIDEVNVPQRMKGRGRRNSRMLTSFFAVIVFGVMISIYLGAAWLTRNGYENAFSWAGYVITVAIKVCQAVWNWVSHKLVDMEYHRHEVDYFESWSSKTVNIQLICNVSPFMYIAFMMRYVDQCPTLHGGDCFGYLCYEMVIVFFLYIVFTLWDIIYPVVVIKVAIWREKREAARRGFLLFGMSFLEKQSKMDEYNSACLSEDYCEHIMPLAFVVLIGMTLPCSPVLALISSLLQIRADGFKLTTAMQRPFPLKAKNGLGIWAEAIDNIALLAVYTNVGIISFLLEPFSSQTLKEQCLVFFSLSTAVLALRKVIEAYLPLEDDELTMAIKRQKHQQDVVHRVQEHYMESLVVHKPVQGKPHLPEHIMRNREKSVKPLRLTIGTNLDLTTIRGLESDSAYFETF